MKKVISVLFALLIPTAATAQVPYFAGSVGNNKLYGDTSLKVRPGINAQETYTTFQYGLGNYTAVGLDLYTGTGSNYAGYLFRAGKKISKWFGIGGQITPSFDLNNNFQFSYLTTALYTNGAISNDGNFFWCSNNARRERSSYNSMHLLTKPVFNILPLIHIINSYSIIK